VTLLQSEHLPAVGALLGRGPVDPVLLRRNLVVAGCNLRALQGRRFTIGDVELEGTGECHPCSRMEEALGEGGYQAMRGHGGLNARILRGGTLRVGDAVELCAPGEGVFGTSTASRGHDLLPGSADLDARSQEPVAAGRSASALHADHEPG
jgi:MOSC domain-containing protein YiiM